MRDWILGALVAAVVAPFLLPALGLSNVATDALTALLPGLVGLAGWRSVGYPLRDAATWAIPAAAAGAISYYLLDEPIAYVVIVPVAIFVAVMVVYPSAARWWYRYVLRTENPIE